MGKEWIMRVPDPFDGTAEVRLARMGLIGPDGTISKAAMTVFVRLYAALFFDDLCDFYDDAEKLGTIFRTFRSLDEKGDYQHMLLLLSLQYDSIRKPLPDPIWWLSGYSEGVEFFMRGFYARFQELMAEGGFSAALEKEAVQV